MKNPSKQSGRFFLSPFLPRWIKEPLKDCYHSRFKWKYIDNFSPWMTHQLNPSQLSPEEKRILEELNEKGVAVSSIEKLFKKTSFYQELQRAVSEHETKVAPQIDQARAESEELKQKKGFIYEFFEEHKIFDSKNLYLRFAQQAAFQKVADGYFEMKTSLCFLNVWRTFLIKGKPRRSQLWHQDPEDKQILKIFVYLSDVDESAGPVIYASGSHPKGSVKKKPQCFKEKGHSAWRATDEEMKKVIPQQDWVQCTGAAGTLVFMDTQGFHKGGFAQGKERLLFQCMFVSPASKLPEIQIKESSLSFETKHLKWKVPQEDQGSEALKYRSLFASKLAKMKGQEICEQYARLNYSQMKRLLRIGEKHVLGASLKGRGMEVGSGTALAASVLSAREKIQQVYCMDYVEELVAYVQPRVIREFVDPKSRSKIVRVNGSYDFMELKEESLDFIVNIESWHHSENLNRSIQEAYRVLKPGGVVLGFDRVQPNSLSDEGVNDLLDQVYDAAFLKRNGYPSNIQLTRRMNGEHEYREREWREAFEKAGFRDFKTKKLHKRVPFFLKDQKRFSLYHFKKWLHYKVSLTPYSHKSLTCFAAKK